MAPLKICSRWTSRCFLWTHLICSTLVKISRATLKRMSFYPSNISSTSTIAHLWTCSNNSNSLTTTTSKGTTTSLPQEETCMAPIKNRWTTLATSSNILTSRCSLRHLPRIKGSTSLIILLPRQASRLHNWWQTVSTAWWATMEWHRCSKCSNRVISCHSRPVATKKKTKKSSISEPINHGAQKLYIGLTPNMI